MVAARPALRRLSRSRRRSGWPLDRCQYEHMLLEPLRESDPKSVGPYRLAARLGSGGMGIVFLGETDK